MRKTLVRCFAIASMALAADDPLFAGRGMGLIDSWIVMNGFTKAAS